MIQFDLAALQRVVDQQFEVVPRDRDLGSLCLVGQFVALEFVARDELLLRQGAAVGNRVFLVLQVRHSETDLVGLLQDLVGHFTHVTLQWVTLFTFDL